MRLSFLCQVLKFRGVVGGVTRTLLYTNNVMLGIESDGYRSLSRRLGRKPHLLLDRSSINDIISAFNERPTQSGGVPLLVKSLTRVIVTAYILDDATEWEMESRIEAQIRKHLYQNVLA